MGSPADVYKRQFHGREPECVTECINQCTDQSATHHCDKLSFGDIVFVSDIQFAYQMGDAPEKEQDTCLLYTSRCV